MPVRGVHGFVRKALPLAYTDLGEQVVKNIDEPVVNARRTKVTVHCLSH